MSEISKITGPISVSYLAKIKGVKPYEIMAALISRKIFPSGNEFLIDENTAKEIATETPQKKTLREKEEEIRNLKSELEKCRDQIGKSHGIIRNCGEKINKFEEELAKKQRLNESQRQNEIHLTEQLTNSKRKNADYREALQACRAKVTRLESLLEEQSASEPPKPQEDQRTIAIIKNDEYQRSVAIKAEREREKAILEEKIREIEKKKADLGKREVALEKNFSDEIKSKREEIELLITQRDATISEKIEIFNILKIRAGLPTDLRILKLREEACLRHFTSEKNLEGLMQLGVLCGDIARTTNTVKAHITTSWSRHQDVILRNDWYVFIGNSGLNLGSHATASIRIKAQVIEVPGSMIKTPDEVVLVKDLLARESPETAKTIIFRRNTEIMIPILIEKKYIMG